MTGDLTDATVLRIAGMELSQLRFGRKKQEGASDAFYCEFLLRGRKGAQRPVSVVAASLEEAVLEAIQPLCIRPVELTHRSLEASQDQQQIVACVQEVGNPQGLAGVGRYTSTDLNQALLLAALKAASHAGLLQADYRANNQKVLRGWSGELIDELSQTLGRENMPRDQRLESEGIVLEYLNRVASAAVVTATNHPRPDSILSLFDTSAWLFDSQGRRRDAYTETDLWLAWYPGVDNDDLTVDEVIRSMPAAPPSKIPWIVRLFENPESWIRFRGAVDLEDHDVLHVLLGRGLQDQDEAFVIGFAMGTAKKISWFQYWIFKLVLARLYPEPYRIPRFLQPAFNLGVKCGQATGAKDLYQRPLKELRMLTLAEARRKAEIDMGTVRSFYEQEQQQIPFTIASLRLP